MTETFYLIQPSDHLAQGFVMFANSKGQLLSQHSYAVGRLALQLFDDLGIQNTSATHKGFHNISNFRRQIFLAGLLHDIGKVDSNFQSFLKNNMVSDFEPGNPGVHIKSKSPEKDDFSFLNYPRHNEVSWALFGAAFSLPKGINNLYDDISYTLYYHHENIKRDTIWGRTAILSRLNKSGNTDIQLLQNLQQLLNEFHLLSQNDTTISLEYQKDITSLQDSLNSEDPESGLSKLNQNPPRFLFESVCNNRPNNLTLADFEVENEAKRMLLRGLIVSSDREISQLSVNDLKNVVENGLYSSLVVKNNLDFQGETLIASINNMVEIFAEHNENSASGQLRDSQQTHAAQQLYHHQPMVLFGPAGCGKTKIFLQWCAEHYKRTPESRQRLFVIAPRKTVCAGLYTELKKDYLKGATIELVVGDEKKQWNGSNEADLAIESEYFKSDVVVTTIDQITSVMMSHKKIDVLIDILKSYVVFDEFHEFFDLPGIVLLFKTIVHLKSLMTPSRTLLVSATPNYFFIDHILKIGSPHNGSRNYVVDVPTFNNEHYHINLQQYTVNKDNKGQCSSVNYPLEQPQKNGTLVVFNTAKYAQQTALDMCRNNHEKVINFHSRFTPKDRAKLMTQIMTQWKRGASQTDYVLRSGPIVQASLNISSSTMLTEVCNAENWCQRLGRVNRFGVVGQVGEYITAIPSYLVNQEKGFGNDRLLYFLGKINSKEQATSWVQYLLTQNITSSVQLKDVYQWYRQYHDFPSTEQSYHQDFTATLVASLKAFDSNDFTPYLFPHKSSNKKSTVKLSSKSLRGSSVFVLPIEYDECSKSGQWLYVPSDSTKSSEALSVSKDEVNGVSVFFANHTTYITKIKSPFVTYPNKYPPKSMIKILSDSRSIATPLIVSYPPTSQVLNNLNTNALVYLKHNNVMFGLMPFDLPTDNSVTFIDPIIEPIETSRKTSKK